MPTVPLGRPPPPPYPLATMYGPEIGVGDAGEMDVPSVNVDFLMPNSIIINHPVSIMTKLSDIKEELWEWAQEYPLYGMLHEFSSYHFVCISNRAETVELMDESKCLQEINPFQIQPLFCILKLVERKGNETEKLLNLHIGELIGKDLQKFDDLKNPEVNEFRWKMKNVCDDVVSARNNFSWVEQVQYQYPARVANHDGLPQYVADKLPDGNLLLSVQFDTSMQVQSTFTFRVKPDINTKEFLNVALNKLSLTFVMEEPPESYVLKTPGKEEFLISDVPLSQYMYIQEYVCQDDISPIPLVVVHRGTIQVDIDNIYERIEDVGVRNSRNSFSSMTLKKKNVNFIYSWDIEEKFSFQIGAISKLNLEEEQGEVLVEAGLYHGNITLCETRTTQEIAISEGIAVINKILEFNIAVCNIPRNTRLCLAIYEISSSGKGPKSKQSKQELYKVPVGWINTAVYDYRNQLKTGSMTLYAWKAYGDVDMPNPLGTLVSNPDHEQAVTLTITFTRYHTSSTILYPAKEKMISLNKDNPLNDEPVSVTPVLMEEVRKIAERDPLMELHEQERKMLWSLRHICRKEVPNLLPKLLQCVEWDNKQEVAEITALLEEWPKLSPENALELLDYAYAEPTVRSYAIECLTHISDDDLLLYLLQLVQALKHENYLYCHLVEFLLSRALRNMRIGHFFFWHLRSEMYVPAVSIRFGLILEAYCRGSVEHMKILLRQSDALSKFKELRSLVSGNLSVRDRAEVVRDYMKQPKTRAVLSHFLNPIDPMFRISNVKSEDCHTKDSKMVPLWLVFENWDPHGKNIYLIYKEGDDLRQDMLTLQMIRVMDKLWKENGLDLRMNPYSCMSTDSREGIIQVVLNAETIANIQRQKGVLRATSPFRKGSLLDWLRDHNSSETQLNKAIHEFTLSCAGYCVATYVLGIADRHSDNIMILKNGQLFHIDFGHILGNFKEKFNIRRERQPFVLTHDFIYVITKGQTARPEDRSDEFDAFKEYCEKAFLILRQYGSFILSLFAMMISTGLPELKTEKDLNYLRETLKLDLTKEEALDHFRSKFNEALKNSFQTSLNWAVHNMSKNNLMK